MLVALSLMALSNAVDKFDKWATYRCRLIIVRRLGSIIVMPLTVVASQAEVVTAINSFNAVYHDDYALVRGLAAPYFLKPTAQNSELLANALSEVLYRWGAGRREAPTVQPVFKLALVLQDPKFYNLLVQLSVISIKLLGITKSRSLAVSKLSPLASCSSFDSILVSVLSEISARILIGNTNVTYPMKVLLLITGFMPALDSQVRKGLFSTGFSGTNATQFLMPAGVDSLEAKKITRLPFFWVNVLRQILRYW